MIIFKNLCSLGNTWAGGTGGTDTAGLGGVGGPFRLDAGHNIHQLSEDAKQEVPEKILKKAREMAKQEYAKKLKVFLIFNFVITTSSLLRILFIYYLRDFIFVSCVF